MTRDEILTAIKSLSTATEHYPSTALDVSESMREACRLADQYPDHADGDSLAYTLTDAMEGFADMLQRIA